jgi:predicted nucleic acid-binding protein
VVVLDAFAIIAFLRGEPSAAEVAALLREPSQLTAVNAAEVCDQMSRVFGSDPDSVDADLALLNQAGMRLISATPELATEAGRIRARRYHRQSAAVSLADCFAAAAALAAGSALATADPALAAVVRAERGEVHPLPDSKGRRP